MKDDRSSGERTETDERVAENRGAAPVAPATRNAADSDPVTGLPRGIHDDASPLDRGGVLDPLRGRPDHQAP